MGNLTDNYGGSKLGFQKLEKPFTLVAPKNQGGVEMSKTAASFTARKCELCGKKGVMGFCDCSFNPDKKTSEERKTLRDEFAMAALNAVTQIDDFEDVKDMVKSCYEIADAMLEARKA